MSRNSPYVHTPRLEALALMFAVAALCLSATLVTNLPAVQAMLIGQ